MADKLIPINLPPGLFKNGTKHQAAGRWYDANLVRFFDNTIRPVGGWKRLQDDSGAELPALDGIPRAALAWRQDPTNVVQIFATTEKLYAILGGTMHDITPVGFVTGQADTGYTTANGAYGAGPYGSGNYGTGSQTAQLTPADTWQLVPFGSELAAVCSSDKVLRMWAGDPATLPAPPAGAPGVVRGVVATPERFLFALGTQLDSSGTSFVPNGRALAWASQETTDQWDPTVPGSTAGDFELATNGTLVCGHPGRGMTLLWTDCDVHTATYIGGVFVYRFTRVGENCGIIAPNAKVMLDGQAMWMGRNGFYQYDGYVKPIECEVQDYVFSDFNYVQAEKCWAALNAEFGEVWFYYPSASSNEIDRYVVYNYVERHWTVGKLSRTAGYDAGAVKKPVWLDQSGLIFEHELDHEKRLSVGRLADGTWVADGTVNANGVFQQANEIPYVESGPFELGDGDRVFRLQRVVPDASSLSDINLIIYSSFDPTSDEKVNGPYTLKQPTPVQITARQVRLRLEEAMQTEWRAGGVKLGVRESSRR